MYASDLDVKRGGFRISLVYFTLSLFVSVVCQDLYIIFLIDLDLRRHFYG